MRRALGMMLLILLAAAAVRAEDSEASAAVLDLAAEACARLRPEAAAGGRLPDLELFTLALAWETVGDAAQAARYARHLRLYYPESPLADLLRTDPAPAGALEYFDPDPDFSRLVRAGALSAEAWASDSGRWRAWLEPAAACADAPGIPPPAEAMEAYLAERPDAPLAGWAAYQMLWRLRLEQGPAASTRAFQAFGSRHPDHPLGREAAEALDVPWFSPRAAARSSALLPGLGEERLEPGLRESAGALYAELLYLAGTVGFAVAAQHGDRENNLAAAMLFANLLMLNHRSSADTAWAAAVRRNLGERRRFLLARLAAPVTGPGPVAAPPYRPPAPDPGLGHLAVSLGYRAAGFGRALRGLGWVREQELANLGVKLAWWQGLWDWDPGPGWRFSLGAAPNLRGFATRAQALSEAPWQGAAEISAVGAGIEAVEMLSLGLGGGASLQVRLNLGAEWRRRELRAGGEAAAVSAPAATAALALGLAGISGTTWQVGASLEDDFARRRAALHGRELDLPSQAWEYFAALGIYW